MADSEREQDDKQNVNVISEQLGGILHARDCASCGSECGVDKCRETKAVLRHIQRCTDGVKCKGLYILHFY